MSTSLGEGSGAAIDGAYVVVTARRLAERWRERAAALEKSTPAATAAWIHAADELDAHLNLPSKTEALRLLIEQLREDLAADLRRIIREEQSRDQAELAFDGAVDRLMG